MEGLFHRVRTVAPHAGPRPSPLVSLKKLLLDCTQGGMTDLARVAGIGHKPHVFALA
jgi:hypothetical protein